MPKPTYTTHLGMNDILPDETPKWRALEQIIHEAARLFHYEEIRTPIMEQTELIKRGVGQLTDIVTKEIFAFTKGDSNYVLRPELTAPVVRAFVQHHLEQRGGSQKLYYIGPMFRAERPQKGRLRQFHQFGVEIIGSDTAVADAECIAFMMYIYKVVGITNFELKINSVGDPESRERYKQALKEYLTPYMEELSELSKSRLEKNPMRILDSKEKEDQHIIKGAPVITEYLSKESQSHFEQVCGYLEDLNIRYVIDPYLVRGMDYYTRTAFELSSPDLGSQDALAGGGRYDLLVEEIGGQPTPAVGFAAGMERLFIACEELGIELGEPKKVQVYVVTLGDRARNWAITALPKLRESGISATMDYKGRSMKAQMKDADREHAEHTLIVGDNELDSGKLTLRNMTKSEESSLSFDDVITKLSN